MCASFAFIGSSGLENRRLSFLVHNSSRLGTLLFITESDERVASGVLLSFDDPAVSSGSDSLITVMT